jgi:diaminopimelate decarboxylase
LAGLHSHIGSQIFGTDGFELAAARVVRFMAALQRDHGITVERVNLGGGMGIAYVDGDRPVAPAYMGGTLSAIVTRECMAADLPMPQLMIEPGRAIVGPSGVTIYEVGTVKPVQLDGGAVRTYVSVDGGMSDNIRTALYDANYTVRLVSRWGSDETVLNRVVGKHCESGDIVVRDAWLPADIAPGDLIAVAATGAYCRSMASNYNAMGRPPVVAVANGHARTLIRRETTADLLALDVGSLD